MSKTMEQMNMKHTGTNIWMGEVVPINTSMYVSVCLCMFVDRYRYVCLYAYVSSNPSLFVPMWHIKPCPTLSFNFRDLLLRAP